ADALHLDTACSVHRLRPEIVDLLEERGVATEDAAQRERHSGAELLGLRVRLARAEPRASGCRHHERADHKREHPACAAHLPRCVHAAASVRAHQSSNALRCPPSSVITAPFMKLARSEATNTATFATSSGVQMRPSGMLISARFWASDGLMFLIFAIPPIRPSQRSVATGPGLIALMQMFCRPYCSASATVTARSAALAALGVSSIPIGFTPSLPTMFTMRPPPCFSM